MERHRILESPEERTQITSDDHAPGRIPSHARRKRERELRAELVATGVGRRIQLGYQADAGAEIRREAPPRLPTGEAELHADFRLQQIAFHRTASARRGIRIGVRVGDEAVTVQVRGRELELQDSARPNLVARTEGERVARADPVLATID